MFFIHNIEALENIVQMLATNIENIWLRHFKNVNITKHSKVWQDNDCHKDLNKYWQSRSLEDWKELKKTVRKSKCVFFNNKITKITNKKYGPWKLMNQVKKQKLLAVELIQFNGQPCIKLENLQNAFHNSFNSIQSHKVNFQLLDEISGKDVKVWALFSRKELINAIEKYNNLSAPGPDKLTQSHIKSIIKNKECIIKFIDIANTCINLGYWLFHFKTSTTVVIPKPNKAMYDSSKSFCPIVLLNTMEKLFEKMIGE